ncbi:hypothetical protein [Streptomyces sp. DSM 15324]|uniref:hypothetical protein n=1 Tax=Streptomyces sp. DSM 15324 TaxID=1739111 RepID=UPI000745FB5B|nr:hypothetical protein [Streptomyces sp. DSM 15324]KUO13815.1 hypothetical protein AQJ58_01670 [Streptomyces sp. DSM 15324]
MTGLTAALGRVLPAIDDEYGAKHNTHVHDMAMLAAEIETSRDEQTSNRRSLDGAPPCPAWHHAPSNTPFHGGDMRIRAAITLATALLATLAACSSSSDDKAEPPKRSTTTVAETPTTTPTPPDAIELERVADTYVNLYFGGDGEGAYAFLSKRCRAKAGSASFAATVEQAAKAYGPDHPATDVHATVSGDTGRVSYKVRGLPKLDQQGQPWTVEGGAWKYDAC